MAKSIQAKRESMAAQARKRDAGEVEDPYAGAEVIESRERPAKAGGERIERVRMVRTDFKYPLLRLEEELELVNGQPRLVRQVVSVADHVLLKVIPGVSEESLLAALKPMGAKVRQKKPASGVWLVSFENPTVDTVPKAVAEIGKLGLAKYAEPDYIVRANVLPNDASFSSLWGMHNTGQSGGVVDADIDAPEAWDLTTGSRNVIVGVIDTGIDHTHPDLAANMWTNPGEIAGNGVDDDGNGYIDDTRGWDFVNNDNNPIDDNNHGTHCSGTIGGAGNNGAGVAGVNWQVALVGLKFLSASGSGATSDAVEATAYATDIGVTLTSNSWGGGGFSQALKDAIDAADAAGILFVAAAGNSSANSDLTTNYPSGYTSANIIAVASTTRTDGLSSFSNYGATSVDLGAPGSEIYSTTIGNTYSTFNGTSMATPHVAGACALLKAHRPTLTHSEIKSLIMQSADVIPALAGKCVTGGRLNVYNAMLFSRDITMAPGGGLAASGQMGGPLAPSSVTYTLTNRASTAATWTAAADQPWVALSSAGGSLAAGATAVLTVSLTSAVNALDGGKHAATVTMNNISTGRSQTRTVSLDILPPVIISQALDTNPGWPVTGQWAFGRPTGGGAVSHGNRDPTSGATGVNVFGVNLSGDYSIAPGGPWYVTAGPFDLSLHSATQLEFMRWLNTDLPYYVTATIEVSNNGSTWTNIWTNGGTVADNAWSSQRFDISTVADQQAQVWVRWGYKVNNVLSVWAYSGWNIDDVKIRGVPVRNLAFTLPASVTEGDAPANATLTVTPVPGADQTVTLAASDPSQVTIPASIILPAGQSSATFQLTPVDDTLADGSQEITITASSAGFQDKSAAIDIHDNETRTLTLALPATAEEGAGAITGQASVGLNAAADTDVRVSLASSDATELQVPATVIIPAGQTSAPVTLTAPEDSLIDGTQSAMITATVQNWTPASGSVTVTDNEAFSLSLTLPASLLEGQGGGAPVGNVVLTGIATTAVEVTLSSGDATELIVPATLTIQPGQSSGSFPVTILNDGIADGSQTVSITATASGFSDGTGQIIVHDADTPAVPSSPQPAAGTPEAHPDSDLVWSYAPDTGGVPDSYDVFFGTNPVPGAAELVASAVTTPSYSMARLALNTTYYWKIVSRRVAVTADGPVWSFTVPPPGNPVRFAWSTIASPKQVDEPFSATITGYDAFDNVAAPFNGTATIKPVRSDSTIVITEVNPNTPDEIEFVNVTSQAADISGWVVSLYDVDAWPNRKTFTIPAGTVCAAGAIFRLREDGTAPGAYPQFYFGSNLNWTSDTLSTVAVLLSKADGTMADFMCAASASPASITVPAAIPPSQWSGAPVPAPTNSTYDYARHGNSDAQTAANWTTATPGIGALNPGLTVPFPGAGIQTTVTPVSATFAAGVWTGDVRVRAPAAGLQLRAEDAVNHRGDSNAFTVTSLGALTLATTAASYQEGAGTLSGGITVTLPAAAAAPVTVALTSSDTSEVASGTITIPEGQLSASGPLVVLDDAGLDGTQSATLDASAVGYTPASVALDIHDDETTTLTLASPALVVENAGVLVGQGSVSVPVAVAADVRVALASSDVSEITIPAQVIIPAGATSASFDITVVQDALLDGAQNVTLTASVVNWTGGAASVQVSDDETATITLAMDDETYEGVGTDPSAGVVTLGGVAVADVVVTLESGDVSEITVPATVTIPSGQSSVTFPGTVSDDTALDGTQTVTISASAFGNPAVTDTVAVRDNDAASFVLSAVASPQKEGVLFPLTVTAKDVNGLLLPSVSGFVTVAAAGDTGTVGLSIASLAPFVNGVWTGSLFAAVPDTNVRITAAGDHASAQSNAFDVLMGPRISVSPVSFTLSVPRQSSKTRSLIIWNNGAQPLTWSAAGNFWLSASPAGGTIPAGGSVTTTVSFNAAILTEGVTTASLSITSNDALHTPLAIPVTLTVTPPVASFVWDTVPSPQRVNAPFPVTVTTKDGSGVTVTDYEGTVALSGGVEGAGVSQTLFNSPVHTSTANTGTWTLGYSFTPSTTLTVNAVRSYSGSKVSIWTDTGTLQASVPVTAPAGYWTDTPLPTPLVLQAGVTYRVGFLSAGEPYFWRTDMTTAFAHGTILQAYHASGDGFPATASATAKWWFVDLKYIKGTPVAISPVTSGTFSSGVWSGNAAVLQAANSMALNADDGAGHTGASNTFDVTTDGTLGITLSSLQVSETAGTLGGTVTVSPAPTADVVVSLSSSVAGAAIPATATVTVPAGSTSAPFTLSIVDDAVLDGPQTTQIGAVGAGYLAVSTPLVVADNEGAVLTINLAQSSYAEGAGVIAGTITSDNAPVVPTTVQMASSDSTEATAPASVTLAAGATSVPFNLTIIDDTLVDGPQNVVLTAAVTGWASGTKNITVTDNEARTLTLTGVPASISEGAATLATSAVVLTGQAVEPVTVTITSSDVTALPSLSITIPAGASSAAFNLDPVDDALFDGTQNVTLTASAGTLSDGVANVAVLDDDVHHFNLSTVASPQKEGVAFNFTATAKDTNDVTITVPVGGPVTLTATGDGGALSVLPGTLAPFTNGVWTGNVRVMAPDANARLTVASPTATNQTNVFDVSAGSRMTVNPASYAVNVAQNTSKTRLLTVSNNGVEPLTWSAAATGDIEPALAAVLAGLNARHAEITALIPSRHDFTEGVTGTNIVNGGGVHMYHNGNYLSTSLAASNFIPYNDNAIIADTVRFGAGGKYFTRKVPGLFVLAADMSGVSSFTISGSTGNHTGIVEGSTLTATRAAKTYKGFVKRGWGDVAYGAESINHLIIIENDAAASHTWSATVDSDNHVLSGISGRTRLYYLLYSSLSGGNVNDTITQTIFNKFLDVIGAESWMTVTPASGTVAAGGSQDVNVTFKTGSLNTGVYNGGIVMTSNDALTSPLAIPVTMTVTPGIHHFEWDAIPSPQVVNTPLPTTIRARDAANNMVTDFEGTVALTALNTAAAGEATTGTETSSTGLIHDTSYPVHRIQSIYTPAEVGAAGRLSGLALDVATLGSPAASNFNIRLKHTSRVNYATDTSWEGSGWTTVFSGSKTLAAGLNYFTFITPFDYNGTSNLMVDISFVNASYSSASYCRYTTASPSRTIYYGSYSGDPLLWSGTGTYAYTSTALPNLRLVKSGAPAFVSPVVAGNFASGVWTGDIRLGTAGTIEVTASAGGATGKSNPVTTTAVGTLALSIPATMTEGQGVLANAGTITATSAPAADVTVTLESMDASEFTLPAQVVLPAGQTSVSLDITVTDDALLDGPITAQARALAIGYPTVTAATTVADNETTSVSLTLPASITEIAYSTATAQGTVTLGTAAADNLTVQLASFSARLTMPASVVIPAGQSGVTFTFSLPDNTIVDGNEPATITATLAGSAPASGVVQVIDNESRTLTLYSFYSSMSEGSAPMTSAAYVSLSGTTPTALTVALASSDTTELTVPATITIPAGSSQSSYFTLTPVNDSLQDGSQTVTLTASAPTFTNGTRNITILDDELHHFTVSTVASPQVRNGPFNVTFTAKDINNVTITAYAGSPTLTAAEGATSLGVTPATVTGFSSGAKTQSVTVQAYASAAVLALADSAGGSGSSNAFAVGSGSLDHFTWDTISSPKEALTPFAVGIRARDAFENLVTSFTGVTQLAAAGNHSTTTGGAGTPSDWYPFGGYYSQNRCQMIYTAAEVGAAARKLQALAFDMTTPNVSYPAVTLTNFTIRLKHTTKTDYSTSALWESSGWTTVYQGTVSMNQTGWRQINFTTPFDYNGTDRLMVDVSSSQAGMNNRIEARSTYTYPYRALYSFTSSGTPPTDWTGAASTNSYLPNLRLISFEPADVSPTQTTAFISGAWSGNVSLSTPGNMTLIATDATAGKTGLSNAFVVNSFGALSLNLPASVESESAGTITATLSVGAAQGVDLVVALSSSKPSAATVPASVTIPAGQSSVTLPVTVVQDSLLEGDQTTVITASVPGFDPGTASLTVQDDETTTVALTLPVSITEGTSSTAGQATVQMGTTAPADLTVTLANSLPGRLTVPASVTIAAGQSSAAFILTAPNNSIIDGSQSATITATLAGSPPGEGTIQVIDNESTNITLALLYGSVSEGSVPLTSGGYVYLAGTVSSTLTVSLSSGDATELTVPASVTIPAGSSQSGYFTLTPVNDSLQDGTQTVTLTASAAGFINGTAALTVTDDDVHHFSASAVYTPQVAGVPFNVTFTAMDINNVTISSYAGSPVLTAASGGTALSVSPATVFGFSGGSRTQAVTVMTAAANAVITITDAASAASGSTNAFAVNPGVVSRFAWDVISSPKASNVSFPVTVRAQDASGNTVSTFSNAASLALVKETQVGGGASVSSSYPLYNYSYYTRTQYIYLASEMGGARALHAMALNILTPTQTLHSFAIRMKHVSKTNFTGSATWEGSGWTTVFQGDVKDLVAGWRSFAFSTPFSYNGVDSLMLDISFGNGTTAYAYSGTVQSFSATDRVLTAWTNTSPGIPLAWTGTTPSATLGSLVPNVRFYSETTPAPSPSATGGFVNGVWSGSVQCTGPNTGVALLARHAGSGASGFSSLFDISAPLPAARLAFSSLPVQASAGAPFPVTITALDASGNVATGFTGTASINVRQPSVTQMVCGSDVAFMASPFSTQPVMRCESVFPATELGGARPLTALALYAHFSNTQVFENFTIRLKHTTRSNYTTIGTQIWESADWTTVYQGSVAFNTTGWLDLAFTTAFQYDGTSNLLVDLSYNNATAPTTLPQFGRFPDPSRRMIYFNTTLAAAGDPLTWNGNTPGFSTVGSALQMRFTGGTNVTVSPAATAAFLNGVWSGNLQVSSSHPAIVLEAISGGASGLSSPIAVGQPAPTISPEPSFSGGTSNTIGWSSIASATGYEAQASSSPGFANLEWTGSTAGTTRIVPGLQDGTAYHFRVRSLLSAAATPQNWSQAERQEFLGNTFSGTSGSSMPGEVALNLLSTTDTVMTEDFDEADTSWSSTILPVTPGSGATTEKVIATAGPNTSPALPVNQNTDRVGRLGGFVHPMMADTAANNFADGVIEGYFAPENFTTNVFARLMLRATQTSPTGSPYGYGAQISFTTGSQVTVDLVTVLGGNTSSLSRLSLVSTAFGASDNLKVRLSANGPVLTLNAWKASIVGGVVTETPLTLSPGITTMTVTDYHFASGRPGLSLSISGSGNKLLVDDVSVTKKNPTYNTSGTVTAAIAPPAVSSWREFRLSRDISGAGTSLLVDLLDESGNVLATNLTDGQNLGALPALDGIKSVKLRASLLTSNSGLTPVLKSWSVRYNSSESGNVPGVWSNVVSSTQDDSPPVLSAPELTTIAASATLAGTATDATSGVASVTLSGVGSASTSNAFSNWTIPVAGLANGPNSMTVTASDNAVPPNTTSITTTVFRIATPATDSDGDGIADLLEHAFSIPALEANPRSMLPIASVQTDGGSGQRFLTLDYRRRVQRAGLTYSVETSADLITWTSVGGDVTEQSVTPVGDGQTETVRVRVTPALDVTTAKFVRLSVTVQ